MRENGIMISNMEKGRKHGMTGHIILVDINKD